MTPSPPPPVEKRVRAVLLSLIVCPGAGQFLLGRRARGALMALAALGLTCALMAFVLWQTWVELVEDVAPDDPFGVVHAVGLALAHHQSALVAGLVALLAVWLWSAGDAWWGSAPRGPRR